MLHYRFEATSDLLGEMKTSLLPADTTGYSLGPGSTYAGCVYPRNSCSGPLPSVSSASSMSTPQVLLWSDSQDDDVLDTWLEAFADLVLSPGHIFDLFVSNQPQASGLGSRATLESLSGYDLIVYSGAPAPRS